MMEYTDVHFRQMARMLSRHVTLYTEMVVDNVILHRDPDELDPLLWLPPEQAPCVLQLGGSDPKSMATAASKAERYGYREININCGCPSDRVAGQGCFGAALMHDPQQVGDVAAAIRDAVDVEVSIKCRLGTDKRGSYDELRDFIGTVSKVGGVNHFAVHARIAILQGLSPKDNRRIPPLRHDWVYALSRDFPDLMFTINGQIQHARQAAELLSNDAGGRTLAGVMIGRAAYERPWDCLKDADTHVYGAKTNGVSSRRELLQKYVGYADQTIGQWGTKKDGYKVPGLRHLVKPILNLFHGEPGGKKWKREIDRMISDARTMSELMENTLHVVPDHVLDAGPSTSFERSEAGLVHLGAEERLPTHDGSLPSVP